MTDHLSATRLSLKQVDLSALGHLERYALNITLGAYGLDEDQAERGTSELSRIFGGVAAEFDPSRPRRFAGDRTLPRSCYYTLSEDESGSDHKTLLQEMSAYLVGSTYPGLVSLFDTQGVNSFELLAVLAEIPEQNYRALDLRVPSLLIALRPLGQDAVLSDTYGDGSHYVVQVSYVLSLRTCEDVIDLRRSAARRWLVGRFNGHVRLEDTEHPVLLGREPLVDFSQLLPSLLDQWLGCGWSTGNMAGFFARDAGASGLIYPSARTNPWVSLENDVVTDSGGWCFVRYAEAPPMQTAFQVSIASDPWPTTAGYEPQMNSWVKEFIPVKGATINYEGSGPRSGSFSVRGVAEYNRALYRLSQVAAVLNEIDRDPGSDVSGRLAYMALYSEAQDISWLARVILGALLGDAESAATLKEATASAGSDYEREALADTQKLVEGSPQGFRASETLAQALRAE